MANFKLVFEKDIFSIFIQKNFFKSLFLDSICFDFQVITLAYDRYQRYLNV